MTPQDVLLWQQYLTYTANTSHRLFQFSVRILLIIPIIGIAKKIHATHHSNPQKTIAVIVVKTLSWTFFQTTCGSIKYSSTCWTAKYQIPINNVVNIEPVSSHVAITAHTAQSIVQTVGTIVIIADAHAIIAAYCTQTNASHT